MEPSNVALLDKFGSKLETVAIHKCFMRVLVAKNELVILC